MTTNAICPSLPPSGHHQSVHLEECPSILNPSRRPCPDAYRDRAETARQEEYYVLSEGEAKQEEGGIEDLKLKNRPNLNLISLMKYAEWRLKSGRTMLASLNALRVGDSVPGPSL